MIVSVTNRFIYIAIPRTASTATFQAIQPAGAAVVPYRQSPNYCYNQDTNGFHDPFVPPELADFFIFTTVRNPYTRYVSHYLFAKSNLRHRLNGLAVNETFQRFVEVTVMGRLLLTQHEFLGETRIDQTLCQERNMKKQLESLPVLAGAAINLGKANESDYSRPWYGYYDGATAEIVRNWAAPDFTRFGYSERFEDAVARLAPSLPCNRAI